MTDLNKEREAFLGFLRTKGVVKVGWNSLGVLTNLVREAGCTLSYNDIELMQEVWMEKAKAQAIPEWISVEEKLPEITDASVLAHFQNGSIETVHIEDWFKDITDGLDEDGRQKYTKWYLKASNTITHWAPLLMPPIEAEN
ncbi:DUF551 domain-containing protein [Acinetobacter baumannii]|uniref:DUF551 domain-containing protein n=3 Tax=Acinetobacter baumannii TaxID=470 RepID=UPI0019D16405|nr:DUF551 domain-containing protein [Acinetobacter baumannii]HBY7915926.1 DUF551 domain-containing protein [Acinetobacter baumannii]HBY9045305.1 DUF551 domain-containing protein [Acinetobacter baumannii]